MANYLHLKMFELRNSWELGWTQKYLLKLNRISFSLPDFNFRTTMALPNSFLLHLTNT